MDKLASSRIGVEPFNLPLNAEISDRPSTLFEVASHEGKLVIGANPWHYITKKSATHFEVLTLKTHKKSSWQQGNSIKFYFQQWY
jgi:DDB1- and CUL4-associated factor 17